MKFFLNLALLLTLSSAPALLQAQLPATGEICVTINDVEGTKGNLVFVLWNEEDGFPREVAKAYRTLKQKPSGTSAEAVFSNLPYGTYAVSVWHDADANGEINANFFGMPRERVGASNQTGYGRPSFSRSRFELAAARREVSIVFLN